MGHPPCEFKYVYDVKNMKVNFLKESCGTSSQDVSGSQKMALALALYHSQIKHLDNENKVLNQYT